MSASSPSPSSTPPPPPSNSTTPSASPPPLSPPPAAAPPPSSPPPPPVAQTPVPPPPVAVSSPPPVVSPPPPPVRSPPPPVTASPPTPALSPPPSNPSPPTVPPPASSPPPTSSPAPPTVSPSPPSPPLSPPPIPASPPTSPPPPRTRPPARSPPSPPSPPPTSPPPPPARPPARSPPSPPTSDPQSPPPSSSPPPTKSEAPPPPRNSSVSTPATPSSSPPPTQPVTSPSPPPRNSSVPTPPTQSLPTPTTPPGNLSPPVSRTPNNPSNTPDTNTASGNVTSSKSSGIGAGGLVGISIVAGAAVIFLILGIIWVLRKRKERETGHHGNGYVIPSPFDSSNMSDSSHMKTPTSVAPLVGKGSNSSGYPYSPSEPGGLGNSRSWFTYEELLQVTNGFSEQNLLGEGGFGPVYKGLLPDGREVAVKQLKVGGTQGEREFRAEVEIISRIHHRHLVSLVGYCIHESQRLLVYDYVPNNTLHYHLHGEGLPTLDWATRVKVAAGAAGGIAYLHEDCHPRIIHRDIKSSNILLDNNFEAQVSDFGLARLALDSFTHVTTRVMGTFGYLAPEYASSGKLTEKSDVYSFGVVLLELVTGRKPVDTTQPLGDESLVEWARPLLSEALESGNVEAVVDQKLEGNYVESEMLRMIEAAAACVRHSATKRPRMGQVVRALDNVADLLDISNGTRPGESELFDSAQQSAEIRLFQRMAFGSQEYGSDFSQASWRTNSKV